MNDFIKGRGSRIKIILLVISLLLLLFSIVPDNKITGYIVSNLVGGGDVTDANISITENAGYWQAFYGELFENPQADQRLSSIAQGGNVTELNLTLPCIGKEIYASTSDNVNLQNVVAGNKQMVDDYLQLDATHLESGSSVFIATSSFLVRTSNITNVPTTHTKVYNSSDNTTFSLGLLNESNNMVFVSPISYDSVGFDNKRHDYQMMVPVNQNGATYYFLSDCVVPPVPPLPKGRAKKFPFCGDDICQPTENCSTCPQDCGVCPFIPIPEEVPEEIIEKEIEVPIPYIPVAFWEYILSLKKIAFTLGGIILLLLIVITILSIMINNFKNRRKRRK